MFIYLCIVFLMLQKIHSSPLHYLEERADESNSTSTTLVPSNTTAANSSVATTAPPSGNTTQPAGTNMTGAVGNLSSANSKGDVSTANLTTASKANGSLSNAQATDEPTVFSWVSLVGEGSEDSKESSEECPFGFLQCVCDAVTDLVVGSSEEDDDDKAGNGIFGLFSR